VEVSVMRVFPERETPKGLPRALAKVDASAGA